MSKRELRYLGIFGVAGYNRGDDAIAKSLTRGFSDIDPGLRFVVPVLRDGLFDDDSKVSTFRLNRKSLAGLWRLARSIAFVDAVVIGGGSLIQDQFGGSRLRGILGYVWMTTALARLLGKPIVTAPIGIDQLRCHKNHRVAREILARLNTLTVRDQASATLASRLYNRANPVVCCDPAFGFRSNIAPKDQAPIVLAPAMEGADEARIKDVYVQIAERLAETTDVPIRIVCMDERLEEDGGKSADIVSSLSAATKARVTIHMPTTPEEASDLVRSARGVIAMRLHALILAYGFTSIFCLSRTTKTDAMMQDYDIPGVPVHDLNRSSEVVAATAVAAVIGAPIPSEVGERRQRLNGHLKDYYRRTLNELNSLIARS